MGKNKSGIFCPDVLQHTTVMVIALSAMDEGTAGTELLDADQEIDLVAAELRDTNPSNLVTRNW